MVVICPAFALGSDASTQQHPYHQHQQHQQHQQDHHHPRPSRHYFLGKDVYHATEGAIERALLSLPAFFLSGALVTVIGLQPNAGRALIAGRTD
jgi:hypothetical protein